MTRKPETIAAEIKRWNRQDVAELRALLAELNDAIDPDSDHIERYVDMTDLPSVDIPADVNTGYPVWAVDAHGNMLVGDTADQIMSLDEYRAQ